MTRTLTLLVAGVLACMGQYTDMPGSVWRLASDGANVTAFGTWDGKVGLFDAKSKKVLWSAAVDGFPFAVAASEDGVLAGTAGGTVWAFDRKGRVRWRQQGKAPVYGVTSIGLSGGSARNSFAACVSFGQCSSVRTWRHLKLPEPWVQGSGTGRR